VQIRLHHFWAKSGRLAIFAGGGALALSMAALAAVAPQPAGPSDTAPAHYEKMMGQYCGGCHNDTRMAAGWSVSSLHASDVTSGANTDLWEKILTRLSRGEMPPKGMPRPPEAELAGFTTWLRGSLDRYAEAHPDPGRATLRRMNRAEYSNAVRDLFGMDVNVAGELPADDAGYGFDNIADVLTMSPTLMDRYIAVAGKVSRMATGLNSRKEFTTVYIVPKEVSLKNLGTPSYNERANDALPLDSRGGGAFKYYAPYDGIYEIRAYLNANTNTELDRLPEDMVSVRVPLKAGMRTIGMSFRKDLTLDESVQKLRNDTFYIIIPADPPQPMQLNVQVDGVRVKSLTVPSYRMSNRFTQANYLRDVQQMEVEGPFDPKSSTQLPSRQKIFLCHPSAQLSDEACARRIVTALAGRAYRRPVTGADIQPLMAVYRSGRQDSDFEHGIAAAVRAVLVSPKFLFLVEDDPKGIAPGTVHPVSDLELASRLSLFLWSSIPDPELLAVARANRLHERKELAHQVARMLDDPKSKALTDNFAGQWLYLRNLEFQKPDIVAFPEFDTRLRDAMKQETSLFFSGVVRENRSILDFINSDYTYLNQRLAEHYGIPGVYGTAFRKVALDPAWHRGGLLGQASILTVTSYDNHTSVVKRGRWILDNILASPVPPPPPNVPSLKDTKDGKPLTAREQMEMHRANPVCASCHTRMDPLGFSLENYDAVGAWRVADAGKPLDVSAVLNDGTKFNGPGGLQNVLMSRKDQFAQAFTERLFTYAIARGLEGHDMPSVRAITAKAVQDDYRIRTVIMGIVTSNAFLMKRSIPS